MLNKLAFITSCDHPNCQLHTGYSLQISLNGETYDDCNGTRLSRLWI